MVLAPQVAADAGDEEDAAGGHDLLGAHAVMAHRLGGVAVDRPVGGVAPLEVGRQLGGEHDLEWIEALRDTGEILVPRDDLEEALPAVFHIARAPPLPAGPVRVQLHPHCREGTRHARVDARRRDRSGRRCCPGRTGDGAGAGGAAGRRAGAGVRARDGATGIGGRGVTATTPGLVCAHHHLYSALARGMPAPPGTPTDFTSILELVWWRLDPALALELVRWSALPVAVEERLIVEYYSKK